MLSRAIQTCRMEEEEEKSPQPRRQEAVERQAGRLEGRARWRIFLIHELLRLGGGKKAVDTCLLMNE